MMEKLMKIGDVAAGFFAKAHQTLSQLEEYICIMCDIATKQQCEKPTSPPAFSILSNSVDTITDIEQAVEDEKGTVVTSNATWKEGGSSTDMPFSKNEGPVQNSKNQKTWALTEKSNNSF
eukprot:10394681-Ditylum_brightwellii.AAC.2